MMVTIFALNYRHQTKKKKKSEQKNGTVIKLDRWHCKTQVSILFKREHMPVVHTVDSCLTLFHLLKHLSQRIFIISVDAMNRNKVAKWTENEINLEREEKK